MIGNWVNWEIWARGALCSHGWWLLGGCSRLVGGVSCALVVCSRVSVSAWLGADMGLGKTIQVLALLLVQRAEAGIQR